MLIMNEMRYFIKKTGSKSVSEKKKKSTAVIAVTAVEKRNE